MVASHLIKDKDHTMLVQVPLLLELSLNLQHSETVVSVNSYSNRMVRLCRAACKMDRSICVCVRVHVRFLSSIHAAIGCLLAVGRKQETYMRIYTLSAVA